MTATTARTLTAIRETGVGHNGCEYGKIIASAERAGFVTMVSSSPVRWALTPAGDAALDAR